uniref:PDXDC1/PDXD2 second domain-containing protein n=1 Tax=Cyprinodon variegatus TaxID=28743 RepID=A0A3Q2EA29_CYPVA
MTLTPGRWLGLPAVTAVTLYRHEDPAQSLAAGLTSSQPVEKLRALPLWLSLQHLGHNGIVQKIRQAADLVSRTCSSTLNTGRMLLDQLDDGSPNSAVVLFKFSPELGSGKGRFISDHHSLNLGEQLAQLAPSSGVDVVELEDEGTCVRFSPLLTAADPFSSTQSLQHKPGGAGGRAPIWTNQLIISG